MSRRVSALGLLWLMVILTLAACGAVATPVPTLEPARTRLPLPTAAPTETAAPTAIPTETSMPTPTPVALAASCVLSPLVAPTMPAEIPGYTEADPVTGLHMTGRSQEIDLATYRLEVTGKVNTPLSLTLDDLRCLPKVEATTDLNCPGFFTDHDTWSGVPIREVLALAGVQEDAASVRMIGADGYSATITLDEIEDETCMLAYQWRDEPLPRLHGFPLRAALPGITGGKWVKWLLEIEVR